MPGTNRETDLTPPSHLSHNVPMDMAMVTCRVSSTRRDDGNHLKKQTQDAYVAGISPD